MLRRLTLLLVLGSLALVACGDPEEQETSADRLTPPVLGECRDLGAADLDQASNADPVVSCEKEHTAQTFAIGTLPASTGSDYDDPRHGKHVFATCSRSFREFLGADESLAMRSWLSWAWFRPSERGWDRGARWYRCDLIGGPAHAEEPSNLPADAKGMFTTDRPDEWLACARGDSFASSRKVPCSESHDWRAVTTVKIGQPKDPWPGDRIVQVRSRDRCSDWVGAWLNYTLDYEFAWTRFGEAEWIAGNRRTVCWARTDQ